MDQRSKEEEEGKKKMKLVCHWEIFEVLVFNRWKKMVKELETNRVEVREEKGRGIY